jgi:hypothetical protein
MKVFVYVKNDRYKLPMAIADTRKELSMLMKKDPLWASVVLMDQRKNPDRKRDHLILEVEI